MGEYSERSTLSVPPDASWAFLEHRDPGREVAERLPVGLVALDDLGDCPDPVKIDTEGAEAEVLRGMRWLVERHRPVILAEMHANKRGVRRPG